MSLCPRRNLGGKPLEEHLQEDLQCPSPPTPHTDSPRSPPAQFSISAIIRAITVLVSSGWQDQTGTLHGKGAHYQLEAPGTHRDARTESTPAKRSLHSAVTEAWNPFTPLNLCLAYFTNPGSQGSLEGSSLSLLQSFPLVPPQVEIQVQAHLVVLSSSPTHIAPL